MELIQTWSWYLYMVKLGNLVRRSNLGTRLYISFDD